MSATIGVSGARPLHPLHAILLGCPVPLFLGALLSDWAYSQTYQVQWANFSSWLIAGALFVGGFAIIWGLIGLARTPARERGRQGLHVLALVLMWVVGLVSSFVHAKDAWASMPEGLYLSALASLLALVGAWLGYAPRRDSLDRHGDVR